MKKLLKKTLAIFAAALMMFSFSTNAFAKNWYFNRANNGYSGSIYQYHVVFNTKGTQKVTINSCSVTYDLYINNIYRGQICPPNEATTKSKKPEYTFAFKVGTKNSKLTNNVVNIKLQARRQGKHSFRIKTTGYYDTITRKK